MAREARLNEAFVRLADTLVADFDVVDLLQYLVEECVALLDADAAGLVLVDQRGGMRVMASTSEDIWLLELLQVQQDSGPCLESIRTGAPVLVPDIEQDPERWPALAAAALDRGFRSIHALPMRLRDQTVGAVNLFHTSVGLMGADDIRTGQTLADIATIGILQQRTVARSEVLAEQLQTALNSRVVIEQAKGVIAATGNLDMDDAYRLLRDYARSRNLRLTSTARAVASGTLHPSQLLPTS